jgi:serine/threonine-protein kinase
LRDLLARQAGVGTDDFLETLPKFTLAADAAAEQTQGPSVLEGETVGPYRLLREIGRGGMSTVWLATRTDEQIRRSVALKLPHVHLNRDQFTERFARERDILAGLTHPSIARLYDAGVTPSGQPFLALEYIDGMPITEYCDLHQVSIRARIDLFLKVLGAVQHAHSHLVIHRDLKPSNILATQEGGITLLDFGIAKLISDGVAAETHLTLLGGRALTPDYASPEQIAGEPLSTSSDVYSLGVVLYELLTGVRPYRLKRDSRGALEDAILSVDPPRPSQAAIESSLAQFRSATIKKIRTALNGDLDTIILKALKKRPGDRYASVDSFRQDIERHLSGHAVLAKSDTLWYRSRKFLVRNRLAAAAATAVMLALVAGLGIALWQANVAERQTRVAQDQARTAEAVQGFMEDLFEANSANQPNPEIARRTTARELLDRGSSKIAVALNDAPVAKLRVLTTLSLMYHSLDLENKAVDLARERVALARSLYGGSDRRLAQALVDLGEVANSADLLDEAGKALSDAEDILDHVQDISSSIRAKLDVQLAYHYQVLGETVRPLSYAQRGIQLLRPRGPSYDLALALSIEAGCSSDTGHPETAKAASQEALSLAKAINGKVNGLLPGLYSQLGYAQTELNEFADAESSFRQSVATSQTVYGSETLNTLEMIRMLGDFLLQTSRIGQGLDALIPAREVAMRIAAKGESSMIPPMLVLKEAHGLIEYGRFEQGFADLGVVKQMRDRLEAIPWLGARVQEQTAAGLIEAGQYAEAARLLGEAEDTERGLGWDKTLSFNDNIGLRTQLWLAQGRGDEAAKTFASFRVVDGESHPNFLARLEQMVRSSEILLSQGEAEKAIAQAAEVRVRELTDEDRIYLKTYEARATLVEGKAHLLTRQTSQALPLLEQAVALTKQLYDAKQSPALADAEIALAGCYLDVGDRQRARELLANAKAIHATHKQLGERYKKPLRELEARFSRPV